MSPPDAADGRSRAHRDAALPLWAATVVLHDWTLGVFTVGAERWGVDGLALRVSLVGLLVLVPLLAVGTTAAVRRHGARGLLAWIAWTTTATAAFLGLVTIRAEVVHFAQYAVVVALLGGGWRGFAIGVALGALDEAFQGVVWYPERGIDLPDVALNGVGALFGVVWRWSRG